MKLDKEKIKEPFCIFNLEDGRKLSFETRELYECVMKNPPKEVVVHRGLETFRKSFIKTIDKLNDNYNEDLVEDGNIEKVMLYQGARQSLMLIKDKFDKELKSLISTFEKVESKLK